MLKTLAVGYRAGDLFEKTKRGERVSATWLQGDVTCHTLDLYDRHAIEKTHHAKAICAPHLPDGPWQLIKFRTGPKLISGELALNLLQEIHLLKKKCACKVEIDFVGRERDKNDLLSKIKDDPGRIRDFSARWKASVPGIEPLEFTSVPGCFCHRRLDEGGLALAEVASRELKESNGEKRLLDMGCGCGLVGYLIAKAAKDISLVMVDSHSRAVEAANINSANLKIPAEVILSDTGTPERMQHYGDRPCNAQYFCHFLSHYSSPSTLRHNIFSRACKPPTVRSKTESSYRPRRHTSGAESIPQSECRFSYKLKTPEYLPIPYLRHPPHQYPLGDRPRKRLV